LNEFNEWARQTSIYRAHSLNSFNPYSSKQENVASRQDACLISRKRVLAEKHAPDCKADVVVVACVRHEVDPDLTTQALRQIVSGTRSAQDFTHTVKENRGLVRLHPVAYIKVITRRGCGHKVAKVTRQRGHPEPTDCEGWMRSTMETPHSVRFSSRPERREIGFGFASESKVHFG
jgi:hypothetical protein